MQAQDFWHVVALLAGLVGIIYAFTAPEFRKNRLFTSGPVEKYKPTWFDRAWLAAFALFFVVTSIVFFVRKLR